MLFVKTLKMEKGLNYNGQRPKFNKSKLNASPGWVSF